MKKTFLLLGLGAIGLFAFKKPESELQGVDIMSKSLTAMGAVKTMSYHFYASERFKDNKIEKADVEFRVIASPLKVYANALKPDAAQLRYEPAVSSDVNVKKGIKINLKPTAGLLLKQQHNPIYKAGFAYMKKVLDKNLALHKGDDLSKFVKLAGSVTYEGKDCHKIILTDPNYGFVNYTIKAGETIWKIAEAKAIPEYKVKELNNWMDYDDMVAGKTIKIPTAYAKVTTLYIDKSNNLPIYQKMEDDKGMYETYEFKELKVNPTFTTTAFDFK